MNQDEVNELRAERLAKTHGPLALMAHSQNSYNFPTTHRDQSSSSTHPQQSFPINNKYNPQPSLNQNFMQPPLTSLEDINDPTEAINAALILFAKAFQLTTPTNNNQRTSSNPHNRQIAQPVMNMSQDRQIQNVRGNDGNQFGQYARQVAHNQQGGLGHIARNCTTRPRRRDAAYLQTQLLIAQKEEAGIQLQAEEFDFMAAAGDLDEIKEEEQYTDLLEPIPKPQLVLQNDNHVTSVAPSMVQSGDFKSLAKEADESLDKQKSLELKIKRLLKANASHDIMSIVQNGFVDVPSDLQTELDRTKEKLELFILKKEKEYAVERLQAQLRDLKGKNSDTPSASNTLDPLNQKLESKIVELEFQVLRARVFENTSDSMNNTSGTSVTPHVDKPKLSAITPHSKKLHASIPSHSVPQPKEFNVVKYRNVIASGMFKINPSQTSRVKNVSSDMVTASSTGLVNTARTRRPQPKGNTRNARVPSASKSSEVKKNVTVEDHRRTLFLSKNQKTMSSDCKNIKLVIQNDKSEIICDTCKQCLVTANHDACLLSSVNALNSRANNLCANVPLSANQKRHRTQVWKPKQVGSKERLACKPRLPRLNLKWSPSGCSFDLKGKLVASKETNCPNDDKTCISNHREPIRKRFPNSTVFLGRLSKFACGYGDLKWGNITITRVYLVEGLGNNLFLVGQFCDVDLEAAFKRNTCFIRDLNGVDLLKGNRSTNLYTINLYDMASISPICLMARATPTKSWLWHQRLSHLNFDTINDLEKNDLVFGLPKFKYAKEHICPSCEKGKSKRASHPPKPVLNSKQPLHLLHMDLCGPMRVASINAPVIIVCTDNKTEFKNHVLKEYFDSVGITHETSAAKTPQQNGVVERRNHTLVEAARTMPVFSHAPLFLWAKAIATNDHEDIGKLGAKGDIGFFIRYSANSVAYRVYNRRTNKIMETMNITFDELSAMDFEQNSSRPSLQSMTSGQISSELKLTYALLTITPQRPSERDLDILFEPLHNDYLGGLPSEAPRTIPVAPVLQNLQAPTASMSFQDCATAPTNSSSTPISSHNVDEQSQQHAQQQRNLTPSPTAFATDNVPNAVFEGDLFVNPFATPSIESVISSTQYVDPLKMHTFYQPIMEPKSVKEALTDPAWIDSMQEELHQLIRLDVWELVSSPDGIKPLTLKWLFKNKHDKENTVIRNKTRLVVRGYRQEEGIDFENHSLQLLGWKLSRYS
uniref:Integrase catalytic domain-containing protein n=1 Tax=Tanacetum cinerariifolium TaxID=118510 RepID=A0A699HVX8_TANCI|nr:hypothetical protein [Tanacetum cinerariifolium]